MSKAVYVLFLALCLSELANVRGQPDPPSLSCAEACDTSSCHDEACAVKRSECGSTCSTWRYCNAHCSKCYSKLGCARIENKCKSLGFRCGAPTHQECAKPCRYCSKYDKECHAERARCGRGRMCKPMGGVKSPTARKYGIAKCKALCKKCPSNGACAGLVRKCKASYGLSLVCKPKASPKHIYYCKSHCSTCSRYSGRQRSNCYKSASRRCRSYGLSGCPTTSRAEAENSNIDGDDDDDNDDIFGAADGGSHSVESSESVESVESVESDESDDESWDEEFYDDEAFWEGVDPQSIDSADAGYDFNGYDFNGYDFNEIPESKHISMGFMTFEISKNVWNAIIGVVALLLMANISCLVYINCVKFKRGNKRMKYVSVDVVGSSDDDDDMQNVKRVEI